EFCPIIPARFHGLEARVLGQLGLPQHLRHRRPHLRLRVEEDVVIRAARRAGVGRARHVAPELIAVARHRTAEALVVAQAHPHQVDDRVLHGQRHDRITAPWFIDEPINGETFQLYIEKVLVPTLRPGDIVIMDNLGSHKGKAVRSAIRAAGARLFYLPKYSPDLNPIEQFFAKLKHWLRKAAKRSTDAVYNAIAPILDTVTSAECANYFANA